MQLIKKKLDEIHPYDKNPRRNDGAVDAVSESIRQCGYIAPIIVDENGQILAGHTRYKALKKLGRTEAEVVVKEGLTEEQKKKYRLLDNKTNELAEWDLELLKEELAGLDFGGLALDWGIDGDEALVVEDEYEPNPPKEPNAKYGQIYQMGHHRLMCGDSTKQEDVERLMGGQTADLLLTDPPYNVGYEGKTEEKLKIKNDEMDGEKFRQFLADAFSVAKQAMKPGAPFYIWHADMESYNFRGACTDADLTVRQVLIWVKNSLVIGRQDYQWRHEPCLYGWADGASHVWYSDRKQPTTLFFDQPLKNKEHPTMKPVPLFGYQIQNSTKAGDIVLDLFGGSGTTIMACEQTERAAYIMELDPKYVDVIIDRWEKFTGEKAVLLD